MVVLQARTVGSRGNGTSFVSLQRRGKVDDPSWNRAKMLEKKKRKNKKKKGRSKQGKETKEERRK